MLSQAQYLAKPRAATSATARGCSRHALYDGDLAIALIWRDQPQSERSRLGLFLVAELEKLGSVDHAVWIPNENLIQPRGA
jgi:hypothetical protein